MIRVMLQSRSRNGLNLQTGSKLNILYLYTKIIYIIVACVHKFLGIVAKVLFFLVYGYYYKYLQ